MRPTLRASIGALFGASLLLLLVFHSVPSVKDITTVYVASVFFQNSIETKEIIAKYKVAVAEKKKSPNKVKILIVPGHDNEYSGAQYGSIREADLNLKLGMELYRLLEKEKGVEVHMTRDVNGYNLIFKAYLEKEKVAILKFREEKVRIMDELISKGKVESYVNVHHNTARPEVSSILYGVNKFASDNEYDIVLHIHFNDYPGRKGLTGTYSGFSIYVPEKQYSNADASYDLARRLRDQLLLVTASSDLPNEDAITEDQELIAVGSFNTLDPAVALIEYGYIYEPQFTDSKVGDVIVRELASQTHRGIMQYVKGKKVPVEGSFESLGNFTWLRDLKKGDTGLEVLALQDRLHDLGYYPQSTTLNTCPIGGEFGPCTEKALILYQRANSIQPTGIFGEITRDSLRNR